MRTGGGSNRRVEVDDGPVLVVSHDSEEQEQQVAELTTRARAIAEKIVRRHTKAGGIAADDVDDVVSSATLRVATRLHEAAEAEEVVHEFENYVATITLNTVYDQLSKRFPHRARLKNRLRYVLTRDRRVALWSTRRGLVCGLAEWQGKAPADRDLPDDIDERIVAGDELVALFRRHGYPVSFDVLVERAADALDVPDRRLPHGLPSLVAPQSSAHETHETLTQLWNELLQLRPMQRKALLFALRDAEESHPLALLVLTGVASIEAVGGLRLDPPGLAHATEVCHVDGHRSSSRGSIAGRGGQPADDRRYPMCG